MSAPRRRDEGGFLIPWILGLCVFLLLLGGLSFDLWRAVAERRALAQVADAAATAGASGIDEAAYRADGTVRLEPARAEQLARENLASQTDVRSLTGADVAVTPEGVTVQTRGLVNFWFVRVFIGAEPLEVRVTALAEPRPSP